jgi:hypothetical protein
MFRVLKDLMKVDKAPADLGPGDLPAWIDGEEEKVREDLATQVSAARAELLDARRQMEDVLSGFDTGSGETAPHPKLAGVTERSLPLFLKAMRLSISRSLPDDPEGFYTAAGEILKGCLSAFRGQGRYLAARFPEEMKVLRGGLDTIGRGVNALTPGISRSRERLRGLAELRESLRACDDAQRRAAIAREESRSLEEEVRAAGSSLEAARRNLADLEKGGEYLASSGELSRIMSLEKERDEAERLYHATAATVTHLVRKGEKVASRKKDRETARVLQEAVALLERDLPLAGDEAREILSPAQGALAAMVTSGDLPLKSREEIDLLQSPGRLVQEINGISRRFQEVSGEISSARDATHARPAFARSLSLRREVEDLEKRIARDRERLGRAGREAADLEGQVKASLEDIRQRVGVLSGKSVRVSEPDLPEERAG